MVVRALALVATVGAAALIPIATAATGQARLEVGVRIDRPRVAPGQIAVAQVVVRNLGPDSGGSAVLLVTTDGGTIVRTRATGARCGRASAPRVRCVVPLRAFGAVANVVVHVRVAATSGMVRVGARIGASEASARARVVTGAGAPLNEVSFVFSAPRVVSVGRPFLASIRILNRGTTRIGVDQLVLRTTPAARVVVPGGDLRLSSGAETTIGARVTPLRAGRLVLDLRLGDGRARLAVRARPPAS